MESCTWKLISSIVQVMEMWISACWVWCHHMQSSHCAPPWCHYKNNVLKLSFYFFSMLWLITPLSFVPCLLNMIILCRTQCKPCANFIKLKLIYNLINFLDKMMSCEVESFETNSYNMQWLFTPSKSTPTTFSISTSINI